MYLKELIKLMKKTLREQVNRPITGEVCEAYRPELNVMIECDMPVKPKPSKWHNVDDDLPPAGVAVRVFSNAYPYTFTAYYNGEAEWFSLPTVAKVEYVIRWRYIGKPPKEQP